MSSATSIDKRNFRVKPDATQEDHVDNGFKPWHFFVLASLLLATVAVVMSRQSSPAHLILISFTIASAGAAAAGFYRMLAPLATEDASVFSEPLTERSRLTLERDKALVMRSIKELEFDRAMGKLSSQDFDEMGGRLRARAITVMKQLDEGGSAYRELIERELSIRLGDRTFLVEGRAGETDADVRPAPDAPGLSPNGVSAVTGMCTCGTFNDPDAAFCKRCGTKLSEVRS